MLEIPNTNKKYYEKRSIYDFAGCAGDYRCYHLVNCTAQMRLKLGSLVMSGTILLVTGFAVALAISN